MSQVDRLLTNKPNAAVIGDETMFWSMEKAANGQKYYFNKKTKVSQWEKPDCLKTADERENKTNWIECTKSDGRVFYYNLITKRSQWVIPPELNMLRVEQTQRNKIDELQGTAPAIETRGGVLTDEQRKELDVKNFLEMLRENEVTINTKWDQVQRTMQNDSRWLLIKQISEKKRIFQEYIQRVKRQEREDQHSKTERAREDYFRMLEESNFTSETKFYKAINQIGSDVRFRALDEKSRETLFQDFLDRVCEQEVEQSKEDRRVHGDSLKKKIIALCETPSSLLWSEVQQKLTSDEDFLKLNEYDRLCVFSDTMYEMERHENDERRRQKRRNDRINRENFREFLKSRIALGEINHKTKWKTFVQTIKDEPEFLNLLGQTGSLPHELFEDQQDLLVDNHKAMKSEIKLHIKTSGMKVVANITYDELIEKMKPLSVFDTLEEYLKNFYYHYFIQKAMVKEKESQKKHKKSQRKYLRFLKTIPQLTKDSQFCDFNEIITAELGEEAYGQIPLSEREEIFKEYIDTLDPNYKEQKEFEDSPEESKRRIDGSSERNGGNFAHPAQSLKHYEPSPAKKQQKSYEEGEEGEIPEERKKSMIRREEDHEEGEEVGGEQIRAASNSRDNQRHRERGDRERERHYPSSKRREETSRGKHETDRSSRHAKPSSDVYHHRQKTSRRSKSRSKSADRHRSDRDRKSSRKERKSKRSSHHGARDSRSHSSQSR